MNGINIQRKMRIISNSLAGQDLLAYIRDKISSMNFIFSFSVIKCFLIYDFFIENKRWKIGYSNKPYF